MNFRENSFVVNENGEHEGGQIVCSVCNNQNGVRWTQSYRNPLPHKWTRRITCLKCGSTERSYLHTGEIIEQRLAKEGGGEIITV